jgi:hypothetical protein
MAKAKADALELIKKLSDDVTTSGIMEELFFKQQRRGAFRTALRDASSPGQS